jgi:hypothetical protein
VMIDAFNTREHSGLSELKVRPQPTGGSGKGKPMSSMKKESASMPLRWSLGRWRDWDVPWERVDAVAHCGCGICFVIFGLRVL